MLELTAFVKAGGILSKQLKLRPDGSVHSDGAECRMSAGTAQRIQIADIADLGDFIGELKSDVAIALGVLREDLPDLVKVVPKAKLNGVTPPDTIARTASFISFRPGLPGFALIDFDSKAMPLTVRAKLDAVGGCWNALTSVLPPLRQAAHVVRLSTSAGLIRSDTGAGLPASGGLHIYVMVRDVADSERFLRALHDRAWLAGYGWMMVGAGGQLLERSIVDRMVGSPERLV